MFGLYRQSGQEGCYKIFSTHRSDWRNKNCSCNFVKKLQATQFYELRIKTGNEYRVVMFAIDHLNFIECTKVVCLCGFHKKSNKDYKKAVRQAEKILSDYLKQN